MPACDQRERRGSYRLRRSALAAVRSSVAYSSVARSPRSRPQPRPGDMPGEAAIVEPGRLVAAEPRRQDLALPGAGGRLKTFELTDHRIDRMRPFHAGVGGHALPAQQETQEVARRHRLDLGSQSFDGVTVNARQQPALAPFLGLRSGLET